MKKLGLDKDQLYALGSIIYTQNNELDIDELSQEAIKMQEKQIETFKAMGVDFEPKCTISETMSHIREVDLDRAMIKAVAAMIEANNDVLLKQLKSQGLVNEVPLESLN